MNDFSALIEALQELDRKSRGVPETIELQSMAELEADYQEFTKVSKLRKFDFAKWLPELGQNMRSLVPGEMATILADTGVGKTTLLHNIALHASPLKTILFEIELPGTLTFERFISLQTRIPSSVIESTYEGGRRVEWKNSALEHIFTCSRSKLHIEDIERIINGSKEKIGGYPTLVLIDYIGLIGGKGTSRYERMSYVAEEIKKIAKSTKTIIIVASQIHRKSDEQGGEVYLHDAKDSGSIENSSGVVLGVWREGETGNAMKIKVLKQTKGKSGFIAHCEFNGDTSRITPIQKPKDLNSWAKPTYV
jgi:replicative DNA helicase